MKEKWTPHIIAATALVVFIVLGLACATAPSGPPPTFKVTKAAAAGVLNEKKVVILAITMEDRQLPSSVASNSYGGIGFLTKTATLLSWNNRAKKFAEELETIQTRRLAQTAQALAEAYNAAYQAETAIAEYSFEKKNHSISYFDKPNAAVKNQIVSICGANNAEYIIAIVGRIIHIQISSIDQKAVTQVKTKVTVFDKSGNIVAVADTCDPNYMGTGFACSADSPDTYEELFTAIQKSLVAMIPSLESSK
jgi:hypothetical protein